LRTHWTHLIGFAAGCALLLSSAGCSSNSSGSAGSGASGDPVTIVMVQGVTGLPFAQLSAQGGKDAAAAVGGIDFSVAGPANIDPSAETKIFQQVLATGPAGIVLQELPPDLFTRLVKDAQGKSITVLPYTIAPAADSTATTFVGDNGLDLGRMGADRLAQALIATHGPDVRGEIVTGICVPGLSVLTQRIDGLKDELAKKLPGVTVLDPFDSKTDPAQNYTVWAQAVAANPDALAMMSPCEADNQNLTKLKRSSTASWELVAFDLDAEIMQGVKDGVVLAVFPQSSYVHGYVATRLLAETLKAGATLPAGWVQMPVVPVDTGNIDQIVTRESSVDDQRAFWQPYIDKIFTDSPVKTVPLEQANQ
jgi:ABC-type sugar transport system substrate-binding protein